MATSAQLAEWRSCPRCLAPLEHDEGSVRCPSCGLQEYANIAVLHQVAANHRAEHHEDSNNGEHDDLIPPGGLH